MWKLRAGWSISERALTIAKDMAGDCSVKGSLTLKSPDGREFTITPLHPENLELVAVGELVVFTYTESVAASVEKVATKPAVKPEAKK